LAEYPLSKAQRAREDERQLAFVRKVYNKAYREAPDGQKPYINPAMFGDNPRFEDLMEFPPDVYIPIMEEIGKKRRDERVAAAKDDKAKYEIVKNPKDVFSSESGDELDILGRRLKVALDDIGYVFRRGVIKRGQYSSLQAFANTVSNLYRDAYKDIPNVGNIEFTYNPQLLRFAAKCSDVEHIYFFGHRAHIFDKLGFHDDKKISSIRGLHGFKIEKDKWRAAESIAKIDIISTMFVTCDLVGESYVGERSLNLLGTVPIPSDNFGKNQVYEFPNVEFKPIPSSITSIHDIGIKLLTDVGFEEFPICSGKVIVTLLLRKRKRYL
jgi:hypothetical protein